MRTTTTTPSRLPRLAAIAIAIGLAAAAGSSHASVASLSITSFTVTPDDPFSQFVVNTSQSQSYVMSARAGGGAFGSSTVAPAAQANWNMGSNITAQTAYALATGNTLNFTDAFTQLVTAGFGLSAQTTLAGHYPSGTLPNTANATGLESGAFQLIDGTGSSVAGNLTFDIYYDLAVSTPEGKAPKNFSQTSLTLTASDTAGQAANFNDSLNSSNQANGVGTKSGHFSWTFAVAAGQTAQYSLSGSAISSSDVPEPGSLALASLALLGGFAARRRAATARRGACAAA